MLRWYPTLILSFVSLYLGNLTRIVLTLASLLCLFSSLVGLTGLLLNSRPILAFYAPLLWPCLLSLCLVGYTSYKRGALQLDRKLNQAWSQFVDDQDRLRIQNSLGCCGYYNPLRELPVLGPLTIRRCDLLEEMLPSDPLAGM
jgi:hypothetical protein